MKKTYRMNRVRARQFPNKHLETKTNSNQNYQNNKNETSSSESLFWQFAHLILKATWQFHMMGDWKNMKMTISYDGRKMCEGRKKWIFKWKEWNKSWSALSQWLNCSSSGIIYNTVSPLFFLSYPLYSPYPLVKIQKTMEHHHVQWVNQLFLWSFSISFCMFTRGYILHLSMIYPWLLAMFHDWYIPWI